MAKAPKTAALTGAALLAAILAGTVTRITEAQAASLDASHFEVNTADVVDGAALVRLTDAGIAAAQEATDPADGSAPAAASGGIEIDDDVAMPEGKRRSPRETLYPFDKLEVGQSFHVAKSAENPDPATRLSSSVSGAHIRFSPELKNEDGTPKTESYTSPVYQKNEDGSFAKDENGKRIKIGDEPKTRVARGEPTREFRIVSTDATDKRGVGARVFRVK